MDEDADDSDTPTRPDGRYEAEREYAQKANEHRDTALGGRLKPVAMGEVNELPDIETCMGRVNG